MKEIKKVIIPVNVQRGSNKPSRSAYVKVNGITISVGVYSRYCQFTQVVNDSYKKIGSVRPYDSRKDMPKIGGICMTYDFDTYEAVFYSIEANEVKTEVLGLAKKSQPKVTEEVSKISVGSKTITSLELVDQINVFRANESKKELRHDTLRSIIKEEFEEEILSQNILEKPISSNGGRPSLVYELSLSQAKQVLVRESKFVRKAVIAYIEKLETALQQASLPSYQINDPIQRAERWIEEQKSMKVLEDRVSEIEPLAKKYEQFFENESAISLRRAVKALNIKHGYTSVAAFLRAKKYLTKNNEPNQSMINRGIFMLKPASETKDCKCFVTIKGVEWLDNYLMENSNQLKK